MLSTHSSSRWRSWETMRTAPSKSSIRCSSASRRLMSRCASGSSSSSRPGRRARQAASATSLRWPPLSSRVGRASASSSSPSAVRCARASLSARSPPSSDHCPSSRSWLASARSSLRMSPARTGSAMRLSAWASSRSSAVSSGRASSTVASAGRPSPSTICGSEAMTSPRRLVTVPASGCSSPARMRSSVDLPPPLGPSTPMRAPAASSRSRPGEDLAAAERLRDAVRRQQRDGRYELSSS